MERNHFTLRFLLTSEALLAFDFSTLLLRLLLLLMSFDLEAPLLLSLPLLFALSAFVDEPLLIDFTLVLDPFDLLLYLAIDLSALERTLGAKADFLSLLLEEALFDCSFDLDLFFLSEDFLALLSLLLLLLRFTDFGRPLDALTSLLSFTDLTLLLLREDFGRPLFLASLDFWALLLFDLFDLLVRDLFKYFEPYSRVAAIVLVRLSFRDDSPPFSPEPALKRSLSLAIAPLL